MVSVSRLIPPLRLTNLNAPHYGLHSAIMKHRSWPDEQQLLEALRKGIGVEYDAALDTIFSTCISLAEQNIQQLGGTPEEIEEILPSGVNAFLRRINSDKYPSNALLEKVFITAVTDEWLLVGLRKGAGAHRDNAFIHIDKEWRQTAKKTVETHEDSLFEMAFNTTFDNVLNWALKPESMLYHATLSTYFQKAFQRTLWAIKSKEIDVSAEVDLEHIVTASFETSVDQTNQLSAKIEQEKDGKILSTYVEKLTPRCQEILRLADANVEMGKIAQIMGYENADTAKSKKCKCMKKLMVLLPETLQDKHKPKKGRPNK